MAAQFAVDLVFRSQTQALQKVSNQLQGVDNTATKLKGKNPFQGIERGAKGAGDAAARAGKQAEAAAGGFSKLGKAVGGLVSAYALLSAGKFIFAKTAELETQTRSIQVLTGSLEKAKGIVSELQQYANVTPFTSSEIIETAKRLSAFGVATEKVVDTTKRLGDVAGATGANLGELSLAYGQVMAKGRLQGEELLQFQERGVALADELKRMYGLTGEEFSKALEKGQISAKAVEVALQRLTNTGGKYAKGAISQSDTLNGKFSTLQDGIDNLARRIGEVLMPVLKGVLDYANLVVDAVNRALAAGRGGAFTRNIAAAGNQITFGATSQGVDTIEQLLGQITPQSNKVGIEQNLQVLRQAQTSLRRIPANDPNADRAVELQGRILQMLNQNLEALKKATNGVTAAVTPSPVPALLGGTDKDKEKKTQEAVRRGVIGGMTGGGQGDASRGRSTGPHLHAQLVSGSNLEALVDAALDFGGGRTASSFGLGRGAASHGYPGRDYYTPQGTPFTLRPGWSATDMGIQGALGRGLRVSGPGGSFELGHLAGVKTGDLNGKGAAGDLLNAQQDALNAAMESLRQGQQLTTEFTRQNELLTAGTEEARRRLEIQYQYQDREQQIAELMDAGQQKELQALNEKLKAAELQKLENELLVEKAQLLENALRPIADENEMLAARLAGTEKELQMKRQIAALTNAGMESGAATNMVQLNQQLKAQVEAQDKAKASAEALAGSISSALTSSLRGLIDGSMTAEQALSNAFKGIGDAFLDMGMKMIEQWLTMQIMGLVGSFFGGAGGSSIVGGQSVPLSSMPAGMAFASGGSTPVNQPVLVGERGPELFVPGQSGGITNHQNLRSMMASGQSSSQDGGNGMNINMSFQTTKFMDREWVDREQLDAAMAQAAKSGAERGHQRTLDKLRQSPSTRRRVGI